MSATILPYRPRHPVVTVEFVAIGWDVVLIDRHGRRKVIDDTPGIIEHAIQSAIWHARDFECDFALGAAATWFHRQGGAA